MPEPPDAADRAGDPPAVAPSAGRAATLSLVCLLVVGAGGAVFAACAVWQAGAVVQGLMQLAEPAPPRAGAPSVTSTAGAPAPSKSPAPAGGVASKAVAKAVVKAPAPPERSTAAAPDPLLATFPTVAEPQAAGNFERRAEASEKVIPLGLEATSSDEEPLTLGEPPPADFPRTRCDEIFVYIVSIVEGAPLSSAASLGVGKKGPARLRRAGERIGDWTVLAISDDWSGLNPDVWLEKDGWVCRAELAGNPARIHQPPKPRPPRRRKRRRR
jgi:hypothetical protein